MEVLDGEGSAPEEIPGPEDRMRPFVVAVKWDQRDHVPANWVEVVRAVDGVQRVEGDSDQLIVYASPQAAHTIEARLGDYVWVERFVAHAAR